MDPEALNLLEGVADYRPRRRMKITDANMSKGELIYTIHCVCDQIFGVSINKYRVICPNCGREAYLHSLMRDWSE
jgi:hypothetical protein